MKVVSFAAFILAAVMAGGAAAVAQPGVVPVEGRGLGRYNPYTTTPKKADARGLSGYDPITPLKKVDARGLGRYNPYATKPTVIDERDETA